MSFRYPCQNLIKIAILIDQLGFYYNQLLYLLYSFSDLFSASMGVAGFILLCSGVGDLLSEFSILSLLGVQKLMILFCIRITLFYGIVQLGLYCLRMGDNHKPLRRVSLQLTKYLLQDHHKRVL